MCAMRVLVPEMDEVAHQCAAFVARLCTRWECAVTLTHALVLVERILTRPGDNKLSADDLRGCIVLALQMTVDQELVLDAAFARGIGVDGRLDTVQAEVLEALEYRVCVSEKEFSLYLDALVAIRM